MNKLILFITCLFLVSIVSCKNKEKQTKSESDIDAARNFIRAALDGKFKDARTYMLNDSLNTNYMDIAERSYERIDQTTKDRYRSSSINVHNKKELNDSTAILIYSNSFKNDHDTLRILKKNNQWLVDLKYLYLHDRDTMQNQTIIKDSLQ